VCAASFFRVLSCIMLTVTWRARVRPAFGALDFCMSLV